MKAMISISVRDKRIQVFLGCLFFCMMAGMANAQQFEGGVQAGLAGCQVNGDTYSGYNKPGLYVGVFAGLPLGQRFGMRLSLNYSQKGSRHNLDPKKQDDHTYVMRLSYIEMPLIARLTMSRRIAIEAGCSAGFLMKSRELFDGYDIDNGPFEKVVWSVQAGIVYQLNDALAVTLANNRSVSAIRRGISEGAVNGPNGFGQYSDELLLKIAFRFGPNGKQEP